MSQTTYIISQSNLLQLAAIASDIDSLKSAQPNGWQEQCLQLINTQHHIIDATLGVDAGLAYAEEANDPRAMAQAAFIKTACLDQLLGSGKRVNVGWMTPNKTPINDYAK